MSVSELCACFPAPAEIGRLAENAQAGRHEAFVGNGHPETVLACAHGEQLLGDVLNGLTAEEGDAPACSKLTAAGEPCKGRPGDDGLCAAHKEK